MATLRACAERKEMPSAASLERRAPSRKRFGGLVAVNDMSFELRENEVLGLIGPNGSGKTTMINLISGALKPTSAADQP